MKIYVKSAEGIQLPICKIYVDLIIPEVNEIAASSTGPKVDYIFKHVRPITNIKPKKQPSWEQLVEYDKLIDHLMKVAKEIPEAQKYDLSCNQAGTTYSYYFHFRLKSIRTIQVIVRIATHDQENNKESDNDVIRTVKIDYETLVNNGDAAVVEYTRMFKQRFKELNQLVVKQLQGGVTK